MSESIIDVTLMRYADTASSNDGLPTFYEIGQKFGTDKVIGHHFWFMYDKYFPAIRQKKLKMLEIGLGCDMVRRLRAGSNKCIPLRVMHAYA